MATGDANDTAILLRRLRGGDRQALPDLFAHCRERLKRMVRLRLDRRLHGRVDPSDVLRQAYDDIARQVGDYLAQPAAPVFLWMRRLTGERLQALHRQHLAAWMADAGQELSLYRGALPEANSVSLAAYLLGRMVATSAADDRAQKQVRLQEALNGMDPLDREILALRHFEELSNGEAAQVLGIDKAEASHRFIGALKRLRDLLSRVPGFFDGPGR
jgi:RNA polymerase sigma-70 factor, ECF subfamily